MNKLIDSIHGPSALRRLSSDALPLVASELREELIDSVAESGGHFSSSLGAVEITLALHYVFNTPYDKIVWDVGHQAYVHKMLTGRRLRLRKIRTRGGISGFLKRFESRFDSFGAGHAGTSISAALGMSLALQEAQPKRHVVAVIGDGSISAGMALEALNHAGDIQPKNFIVILNDNQMSISPNVGALNRLCSSVLAIDQPYGERFTLEKDTPHPAQFFEALGFRYLGPVDGNDVVQLVRILKRAKNQDQPVLVHACTVKGKGYPFAEQNPEVWHGVLPFEKHSGKPRSVRSTHCDKTPCYTSVFAETLIELATVDPRIVAITAGMPAGTGLNKLQAALPKSFIDVGICEQHAVTLAAGLACEGMKPVCAIYSTFLQRAYDQIMHDVCLQKLPVVFAIDRAGVVGSDGETHQGVFDISFLRTLPNMVIMSPKDENELRQMLFTALHHDGPVAMRFPRGKGTGVALEPTLKAFPLGKAELVEEGEDAVIVSLGPLVESARQVREAALRELGIAVAVINARFAKPLDEDLFRRELPKYPVVCSLEDHALEGGFGSALLELVNDRQILLQSGIKRFGVDDRFIPHATQEEQRALNGFDTQSILGYLRDILGTQVMKARA